MNWGYKITFLYLSFVTLIVSLVMICMAQNDLHLVSRQYYEEEIAYQQQIEKIKAAHEIAGELKIKLDVREKVVIVSYPVSFRESLKGGKITFFRPSDAKKDFTIEMKVEDENMQVLPLEGLEKGLWKIKMAGTAEGKEFYKEETLVL